MREKSMTHRPLPRQAQFRKKALQNKMNNTTSHSPNNQQDVVSRLTKEPLAKIELKIAIENKSYEM